VYNYWGELPTAAPLGRRLTVLEPWAKRWIHRVQVEFSPRPGNLWSQAVMAWYRQPLLVSANAEVRETMLAQAETVEEVLQLLPAEIADALRGLFNAFPGPCPEGFSPASAEEVFDA